MYNTKRLKRRLYKCWYFIKDLPFVLHVIWVYLSEWAKRFWVEFNWKFDLYIAYMLYNPNKRFRYHKAMLEKWGDRYRSLFSDQDNYPS